MMMKPIKALLKLQYQLINKLPGILLAKQLATVASGDHLSRTAQNTRHEIVSPAIVYEMAAISSSVKMLKLNIADKKFTFKAGQWVDLFIPGLDTVGGFSICSTPDLLAAAGNIDLAVKYSQHPPAHWVHTKCAVGDQVKLRAGGDFYYDPPIPNQEDVCLLAGGVGINPLYSILGHVCHLHGESKERPPSEQSKVSMLYSARSVADLLFRDQMKTLAKSDPNIVLRMHSTREPTGIKGCEFLTYGRIKENDVQEALCLLEKERTVVFLCGPLPFITAMESHCLNFGITKSKIHYEKW